MSSRRTEILEKLKAMGAEPKRSLGQNFLVSDRVIEKIITSVRLSPATQLIEVGPGLGALTEGLIELGRPFRVIELDRRFAEHWRSRGLQVDEGDALRLDWPGLGLPPGTLLVSNLPYQISSSLVIDRSVEPAGLEHMVLMFQKEVAQRLVAKASTKEYGLLTVIAQTFWNLRFLLEAGPGDFYPPPNVSSRVLTFERRPVAEEVDPKRYLKFCKAAFAQRRKLMVKNLIEGVFSGDKSKAPEIEAGLVELGLGVQARAEELDPERFVRLYLRLKPLLLGGTKDKGSEPR